jgi:beta-phosphoglucomutase-like phosphatase (HAD superfamily)
MFKFDKTATNKLRFKQPERRIMESIKTKLKAVIFDMDGTIIQTDHIWSSVVRDFLREEGVHALTEHDVKMLESLSGMSTKPASKAVKHHFGLHRDAAEIATRKMELANGYFRRGVEFIEGFEAFHQLLREHNIPSGIGTNATPQNLEPLQESMKFQRFFGKHVYGIADVNYVAKPDPTLFLHVAQQLGVKPEECIVFEDSIYGFQAAKAAGMKCIGIKGPSNHHLLEHAHAAIDSYHEAVDALKRILI